MATLKHAEDARVGNNRVVRAIWINQFKKPAKVTITTETVDVAAPHVVIEGDAGEVDRTLAGLATIAWNRGWRPKSLVSSINSVVQNVKEPTE